MVAAAFSASCAFVFELAPHNVSAFVLNATAGRGVHLFFCEQVCIFVHVQACMFVILCVYVHVCER